MAVSKEEKHLASIDGTLKDILKELKRQGRGLQNVTSVTIDPVKLTDEMLDELKNGTLVISKD